MERAVGTQYFPCISHHVPTGRLEGGNLHFYRYYVPKGTSDNLQCTP